MTRFVPLIDADGNGIAIDAHLVESIAALPDGLCRIWTGIGEGECIDVPGSLIDVSVRLSDPPAGAVRFVCIDGHYLNPKLVAWVAGSTRNLDHVAIYLVGREMPLYVLGDEGDVIAKLEGRAS